MASEPAHPRTARTSRRERRRRQKFRMAGESDKKLAQHREEQRQLERRARYGAGPPERASDVPCCCAPCIPVQQLMRSMHQLCSLQSEELAKTAHLACNMAARRLERGIVESSHIHRRYLP